MGSPCLFTRQRALKMGIFYWLCVKNSNHLHTEFRLGNLKDTKFYLSPRLSQNTPSAELFSKKIHVLLSKFFSFSNMFFIRLFLENARKKNRVSPCLFPHKLP